MAVLKADTEHMDAGAQRVAATIESVRAEVLGMRGALEDLQGSWQGQAATNFQAVVAQWGAAESQMHATLDTIAAALRHASSAYSEVEGSNARLFQ